MSAIVFYDPEQRRSWQEGGLWPHSNHYSFHEAVVAAHFTLLGYHVLRDYSSVGPGPARPVARASAELFRVVVGPDASAFFAGELAARTNGGSGQPDLSVFHEDAPNDPKVRYLDPRQWFFAEVKGPGDEVRSTQLVYWREVALRLGPDRIRLFRTAPVGSTYKLQERTY